MNKRNRYEQKLVDQIKDHTDTILKSKMLSKSERVTLERLSKRLVITDGKADGNE